MTTNKSRSKTGSIIARVFNFRRWLDWERMKSSTLYLKNGIKKILIPQRQKATESFKAAQTRLNLTDTDLLERQKGLMRLCVLMLLFSSAMFFYSLYLLYYLQIKALVVSVVVMMLGLTLAFRYHFWSFQIKSHKLGCSFREWYDEGLRGRKS